MISFFFPSKKPKTEENKVESDTKVDEVVEEAELESENVQDSEAPEEKAPVEPVSQDVEESLDELDTKSSQSSTEETKGPIVVQENLDDEEAATVDSEKTQAKSPESDQKAAVEAEKLNHKKSKNSEPEGPVSFETIEFYRQPIRKIYYNKHWVFFVEDIISLTGTIDLIPFIDRLKKNPEFQKQQDKYIKSIPVLINGKEESVECINAKGCLWLVPILRPFERFFPGPFPTWIETVSAVH